MRIFVDKVSKVETGVEVFKGVSKFLERYACSLEIVPLDLSSRSEVPTARAVFGRSILSDSRDEFLEKGKNHFIRVSLPKWLFHTYANNST